MGLTNWLCYLNESYFFFFILLFHFDTTNRDNRSKFIRNRIWFVFDQMYTRNHVLVIRSCVCSVWINILIKCFSQNCIHNIRLHLFSSYTVYVGFFHFDRSEYRCSQGTCIFENWLKIKINKWKDHIREPHIANIISSNLLHGNNKIYERCKCYSRSKKIELFKILFFNRFKYVWVCEISFLTKE